MYTFLCPNCNYPIDIDLEKAQGSAQCVACNTQFEVPLTLPDGDNDPLGQFNSETNDAWPDLGLPSEAAPFQFGNELDSDANPFSANPMGSAQPNSQPSFAAPNSQKVNWKEASAIARAKAVESTSNRESSLQFPLLTTLMLLGGLTFLVFLLWLYLLAAQRLTWCHWF